MKTDIILSGVGGQGILSISAVIGEAAVKNNLYMKQAEVHGMSQRGGEVQSNLRISDVPIYSDLIAKGTADMIISVEPMEALRYLPYLKKDGWLITSEVPFVNIPEYPEIEGILNEVRKIKNHVILDVDKVTKELGSSVVANMVMLGASTPFLVIPYDEIKKAIRSIFEKKGEEIVDLNLRALEAGRKIAETMNN